MPQLSDFNSIFEVSIGLHVAYSMFGDVREWLVEIHKDWKVKDLPEEMGTYKRQHEEHRAAVARVQECIPWFLIEVETVERKLTLASVLVALTSLYFLIFSGFEPSLEITTSQVVFILHVVLLPMPLFLVALPVLALREPWGAKYYEALKDSLSKGKFLREWAKENGYVRDSGP